MQLTKEELRQLFASLFRVNRTFRHLLDKKQFRGKMQGMRVITTALKNLGVI